MSNRFLISVGVTIFAISLAVLLRDSLTGEARLVAEGIAVGLILGVPVGMLSMGLARRAHRAEYGASAATPVLSAEQTDLLVRALERQQASGMSFDSPSKGERTFEAVGGADLPGAIGDVEDPS
jgi:hypothetical protein